ncbi:MAG: hypothetical protein ACHQQQ_04075 [Bacteroidota bacterium]
MKFKQNPLKHLLIPVGLIIFLSVFHGNVYSQTDENDRANNRDQAVEQWTNKLKTELNLSAEQTSKVHDILSSARGDIDNDMGKYNSDIRRSVKDRLDKVDTDLMSVLNSSEQKEKYNNLRDTVRNAMNPDSTSNEAEDYNAPPVNNNYYGFGWWWYPDYYWSYWYPGYWRGYYPHYYYPPYYRYGYRRSPYFRYYQHPYYGGRGIYQPRGSRSQMYAPRMTAPRMSSPRMSAPRMSSPGMGGYRGGGGFSGGGRRR